MARSTIAYEKPKNSFEKFLEWTDEKVILGSEVANYIKPDYRSLLDVGAGNGDLTLIVANRFSSLTLVESSQPLFQLLKQKFPEAKIENSGIEEYETSEMYDFILASHVFIYVQNPEKILDKLLSELNSGGTLLIIMLDRTGDYLKYIDHFRGAVLGITKEAEEYRWENIISYLDQKHIPFSTKEVITNIKPPTLDDFLSINDFNFNTDVSNLSENTLLEMRNYLNQYQGQESFSIPVKHKFIVVEKKR